MVIPLAGNTVDFIEEYDSFLFLSCSLENPAEQLFTLSVSFSEYLRS